MKIQLAVLLDNDNNPATVRWCEVTPAGEIQNICERLATDNVPRDFPTVAADGTLHSGKSLHYVGVVNGRHRIASVSGRTKDISEQEFNRLTTESKLINTTPYVNADTKSEMQNINAQLKAASASYYNDSRSQMSDREYDALYDRLTELEAVHGALADSITQSVGAPVAAETPKTSPTARKAPFIPLIKDGMEIDRAEYAKGNIVLVAAQSATQLAKPALQTADPLEDVERVASVSSPNSSNSPKAGKVTHAHPKLSIG